MEPRPTQPVEQYYTENGQREWERLDRSPYSRLEYETTRRFLGQHLPRSGRVLDAGGGPGRYTLALARQGYRMVLLDLTPALLEIAREQIQAAGLEAKVEAIVRGSLADLSRFPDASFDAVLCLGGAIGHLERESERTAAMRELVRVARPGAPVCVSVIGRLAVLIVSVRYFPGAIRPADYWRQVYRDGDDPWFGGRTYAHFFLPEEIEALLTSAGLEIVERVGLEGLSSPHAEEVDALHKADPQAWANWLEAHACYCTHPAVYATSGHMLLIGTKP